MWPFKNKITALEAEVNRLKADLSKPSPVYVTLAVNKDEAASKAEYRGTKVPRVKKELLELDYCRDPVNFAGINWIAALTGANGYDLDGEDKDKKTVQAFLDALRFENWVKRVATNLATYGETFNEVILNKDKTIVASLYVIDPKSMDFSKKKGQKGVKRRHDQTAYSGVLNCLILSEMRVICSGDNSSCSTQRKFFIIRDLLSDLAI